MARLVVALVVLAVVSGGIAIALLVGLTGSSPAPGPKTAAIVDQLSLTQPKPAFAETAAKTLEDAGYLVDYFPGEEVTLDFYRDLPTHDYDLIVLRVHSGRLKLTDDLTDDVTLFTGERYSEAWRSQEPKLVGVAKAYYQEGGEEYFAIMPDFIRHSMQGRFDGTLIVMMGCDGLRSQTTAQAFLEKGASAFVSWSRPVSAAHTDAATQRLLENLLAGGFTVPEAVYQTAAEVGPDPTYGAELRILTADK